MNKTHIRLTGAAVHLTACGKLASKAIEKGDKTKHMPYTLGKAKVKAIFTCEDCLAEWYAEDEEEETTLWDDIEKLKEDGHLSW